jgi:uncharacterized membrane protein
VDKFIVPNFHVILIHFPLGLLTIGVTIELFSFLWRRSSFRQAGRWMILLGTLMAVPALTSGLYALRNVVGHGADLDSWSEYKAASNFNAHDWEFVRYHVLLNAVATGLALFATVTWLGASDTWRKILHVPALLMLVAAVGLMVDGGWHGGEMVYRLGFAVQGKLNVLPDSPDRPQDLQDKIEFYAPQGEVHLLMAGFVLALAAAALGLSIRRSVTSDTVLVQRIRRTNVPASGEREGVIKPISLLQALNDPGDEIPVGPRIPASRFWLLAALVAVAAIISGLWFGDYLAPWPRIIDLAHFQWAVRQIQDSKNAREGLHIVFGASILMLTLLLALLTRLAPKSRVFLSALAFGLVLAMAVQVWLGVLLTFDGGRGPLARFKTDAEANTPEQETPSPTTVPATAPSVSPPAATQPIALGQ